MCSNSESCPRWLLSLCFIFSSKILLFSSLSSSSFYSKISCFWILTGFDFLLFFGAGARLFSSFFGTVYITINIWSDFLSIYLFSLSWKGRTVVRQTARFSLCLHSHPKSKHWIAMKYGITLSLYNATSSTFGNSLVRGLSYSKEGQEKVLLNFLYFGCCRVLMFFNKITSFPLSFHCMKLSE